MLCVSRPGSLAKSLRRAQHLAFCDEVVRYSRYEISLPPETKDWVLRMFDMWRPTFQFFDDTGEVAHWMRLKYPELYKDLAILAEKIERTMPITNTDWDLMIAGVEKYRRHLLDTVDHCDCF